MRHITFWSVCWIVLLFMSSIFRILSQIWLNHNRTPSTCSLDEGFWFGPSLRRESGYRHHPIWTSPPPQKSWSTPPPKKKKMSVWGAPPSKKHWLFCAFVLAPASFLTFGKVNAGPPQTDIFLGGGGGDQLLGGGVSNRMVTYTENHKSNLDYLDRIISQDLVFKNLNPNSYSRYLRNDIAHLCANLEFIQVAKNDKWYDVIFDGHWFLILENLLCTCVINFISSYSSILSYQFSSLTIVVHSFVSYLESFPLLLWKYWLLHTHTW